MNATEHVGCAFHPIFFSGGPTLTPGSPASTKKADTPAAPPPPVRAMTSRTPSMPQSRGREAPEMKHLSPVSACVPSPRAAAAVRSAAASDPAPGSVRQ